MLDKITRIGNFIIRIITGVLAVVFLLYSTLTLWDMYRTELKAFASYDLLKYRPNIEEDEPPYLDDLIKINPDVAGWVTIYGTNIDYPVFQGETDTEYLNKNAYGDYTISGSIFMSVLNKKDFSDPYTLLYGHHMANGSMFGDIDKFKDKDFFYNKNGKRYKEDEGVLIMENKVYNLKVFAIVETSAFNYDVYRPDKTQEELQAVLPKLKEKSKYYIELDDVNKVLALSTCDNAQSFSRSILLCKMTKRTDPLPTREEEPLTPHRKAVGHPMAGAYWSLLNLFCLILTLISAFPLHLWIKKDTRRGINKKFAIAAIIPAACAVALFIITEDLHKPIQVIDVYTPAMILLLALVWLLQVKAGGYKIKSMLKNEKAAEEEPEQNSQRPGGEEKPPENT